MNNSFIKWPPNESCQKSRTQFISIGGTFDALHPGHKQYIRLAFKISKMISLRVRIYITTDSFAQKIKNYEVLPFEKRKKRVETFISNLGCQSKPEIIELNCINSLRSEFLQTSKITLALVSDEYHPFFNALNEKRRKKGLSIIPLLLIPRKTYHKRELSSTAIRAGKVDSTAVKKDAKHLNYLQPIDY